MRDKDAHTEKCAIKIELRNRKGRTIRMTRNAQESGLQQGDRVLLKQCRSTKLDTPFCPEGE